MSGLVLAVGFSWLLCLGLILTVYWPEWFRPGARTVVWLFVAALWFSTAAPQMVRAFGAHSGLMEVDSQGLFCLAQVEYLRGEWEQAERLLLRLLRFNADDCDARLMLATLYRRCSQWDRCREHLDQLERAPDGSKWVLELTREGELLRRHRAMALSELESGSTREEDGSSDAGDLEITEEAA